MIFFAGNLKSMEGEVSLRKSCDLLPTFVTEAVSVTKVA